MIALPGTHLLRIFADLGFAADETCWCRAYAEQMDLWGPNGCRDRLGEIVAHLREMRRKTSFGKIVRGAVLGLARGMTFIDPVAVERSLVLEAIRRAEEEAQMSKIKWQVGLTTCPARFDTLLPETLRSLERAGWSSPRIFVDGRAPGSLREKYEVTERNPRIKTFANWILGLGELYARNPCADRYLMVQDDVAFVRNLRSFLERKEWPGKGYLNLYTTPCNQPLSAGRGKWFESRLVGSGDPALRLQTGKGALAFCFNHESVRVLLSARHNVDRIMDPTNHRGIDGAVVTAMNYAGYREYCFDPSLVQHTGKVSAVDKRRVSTGDDPNFPQYQWEPRSFAVSFPGEDFDALKLLEAT